MIRTGVDFAKNNGDETVMVFLRYEDTVSTIVAELRGEAAEYVAALEAKLGAIERDRDELWCRALTTLEDAHMIQRVLERFDQLRPDKLAAAQEEKE